MKIENVLKKKKEGINERKERKRKGNVERIVSDDDNLESQIPRINEHT